MRRAGLSASAELLVFNWPIFPEIAVD